ncbi:MAG: hypothetical protein JO147_13790 [Actinobacteria bacterium]|nr:hypothetical protein [Actinomycetota bacterium]
MGTPGPADPRESIASREPQFGSAPLEPLPPVSPSSRVAWVSAGELSFGVWLVLAMAVVGVALGIVWHLWSRTPTQGLVYTGHSIVPDETEGFISSDGRFLVLTAPVGVLAGLFAWSQRRVRGPAATVALGLGGIVGAGLTALVGHLVAGGSESGQLNTVLARLPLRVHALGLLVIEAALALIVYLLPSLFVSDDQLGYSGPSPQTDPQTQMVVPPHV